ncbi:hypothetical protein ASE00_02425 [Sphingomonas sp. Root710]|uniref:hypothetical protein n=1 Tax=Sphingomonas sp. Root710 TaxID=1736594 RepID=UPI0006FA5383|nr:hypothetical protein [Sphingomonas sp. Root710]KRB85658.1 hypothetical protein ASE00_02425 [Sphingomonas sp. Root710]
MSLFASQHDKASVALEAAASQKSLLIADLEALRLTPADASNAASLENRAAAEAKLAADVKIADQVVAHRRDFVGKLDAEEADRARKVRLTELQKRAMAGEARFPKIATLSANLASLLAEDRPRRVRPLEQR